MSDPCWLSDAQIDGLKPYLPDLHGKPCVGDKRVMSGIIFFNRTVLR